MQELSCTWVPGTIDLVRLRFAGRTVELTSTRLTRIFGREAVSELYLRGRAVLRANTQQIALLT
ncbi:hypothetical protein [Deinococcus aestuarii]|uniref:hypothetical protein n=1 Tax=Deinococcus aestuarii TaxID=2774531 RepID=UPI001C0CF0CD|nr:hypothetical protein [Deinococcus aestuarii]